MDFSTSSQIQKNKRCLPFCQRCQGVKRQRSVPVKGPGNCQLHGHGANIPSPIYTPQNMELTPYQRLHLQMLTNVQAGIEVTADTLAKMDKDIYLHLIHLKKIITFIHGVTEHPNLPVCY